MHGCVCVCVRVEGVQSCRTHCSLLQSQSSYSVYVFVSAWWRRWVLLRPNESICIQGAFFLSHAGGSKRAATWEPVQRLVGAFAVFPKQTRKYKHRLALNSPCFFPLRRLRKLYNHTLSPPALYCTKLGSFLLFSEDWERGGEKSRGWLCTESWVYSTSSSTSRRVAAVDVLTSEWPGTLGNLDEEWMEGRRRGR